MPNALCHKNDLRWTHFSPFQEHNVRCVACRAGTRSPARTTRWSATSLTTTASSSSPRTSSTPASSSGRSTGPSSTASSRTTSSRGSRSLTTRFFKIVFSRQKMVPSKFFRRAFYCSLTSKSHCYSPPQKIQKP